LNSTSYFQRAPQGKLRYLQRGLMKRRLAICCFTSQRKGSYM